MNLKFPFWSIALAILLYFLIVLFDMNKLFALIPTIYLAIVFITTSFYAIKRTFFK